MKESCAMTYFQYPRSIDIKNEMKWNAFELIKIILQKNANVKSFKLKIIKFKQNSKLHIFF